MTRIGNTSYSPAPDATPAQRPGALSREPEGTTGAHVGDQVSLSSAAAALPEDRSNRIAALQKLVESADYSPDSVSVSRKLISEALSRPE